MARALSDDLRMRVLRALLPACLRAGLPVASGLGFPRQSAGLHERWRASQHRGCRVGNGLPSWMLTRRLLSK